MLLHAGLVRILRDASVDVCAEVGDATALLNATNQHRPDVVITDIRMPADDDTDGITAARAIRANHPTIGIVLLSQYLDAARALDLFQSSPAGLGYLLKDRVLAVDEFVQSVRRVAAGGTALDPAIVSQLVSRPRSDDVVAALSDRERAVLAAMAEGFSNTGIAEQLHIGLRTVETHIGAIFTKLDILHADDENRRVKAVLAYLRSPHTPPSPAAPPTR